MSNLCAGGHNIRYAKCGKCRGSEIIATTLYDHAKHRAKRRGMPFSITKKEVYELVFKTHAVCPILGIPLAIHKGRQVDGSPSIDRMVDKLGYVTGNIRVISWLANKIKGVATADHLLKVANYVKEIEDASGASK